MVGGILVSSCVRVRCKWCFLCSHRGRDTHSRGERFKSFGYFVEALKKSRTHFLIKTRNQKALFRCADGWNVLFFSPLFLFLCFLSSICSRCRPPINSVEWSGGDSWKEGRTIIKRKRGERRKKKKTVSPELPPPPPPPPLPPTHHPFFTQEPLMPSALPTGGRFRPCQEGRTKTPPDPWEYGRARRSHLGRCCCDT